MTEREHKNLKMGNTSIIEKKLNTTQEISVTMERKSSIVHKKGLSQLIRENLFSGIIVAVVNLPLSISLAVAGKSTPQAGVITAIISGFISGIIGGSHFNIIGPTGALSGFLANAVMKYQGDERENMPDILPVMAIFTGLLTLIVMALRLQKYIELFPTSVNEGFTVGVAFIIFAGQLNNAFGLDKLHRHEELIMNIAETFKHINNINFLSLIVTVLFIIGFFVFTKAAPKIPWQAILSLTGIIIGMVVTSTGALNLLTLSSKYGDMSFDGMLIIKDWRKDALNETGFYVEIIPITLIAILETLISAKIGDKMTGTKFDQVPEMVALGLSNIVAGYMGGIPCTAALARTSLNVKSGATHRTSSLINGVVMTIITIALFSFFKYLPLSVVAAQVMIVAIRMVDLDGLKHLWHLEKQQFWIMVTVAFISILIDTTYGLILGMFIYLFTFAEKMMEAFSEISVSPAGESHLQLITPEHLNKKKKMLERGLMDTKNPDSIFQKNTLQPVEDIPHHLQGSKKYLVYRFAGVINFMNIGSHEARIKLLPNLPIIVLSFKYVHLLEIEAVNTLKSIIERLERNGKKVYITGVSDDLKYEMRKGNKDWFKSLMTEGKIYEMQSPGDDSKILKEFHN